jgi:hypothetical protein
MKYVYIETMIMAMKMNTQWIHVKRDHSHERDTQWIYVLKLEEDIWKQELKKLIPHKY